MDIVLFLLGLGLLFRNDQTSVLTIIFFLCSVYLQLNIEDTLFTNFLFLHNVNDLGIVLYILFFFKILFTRGAEFTGVLQNAVSLLLLFLFLNGIYDILFNGTSPIDVVKFLRSRLLLTIVYIVPRLYIDEVNGSFRQVAKITVLACVFVIFQTLTSIELIKFSSLVERGIKPPITAIIFTIFYLVNYWNLSKFKTYAASFICFMPIALNMKMTYAISVLLILFTFILFRSGLAMAKKITAVLFVIIISFGFLGISDKFANRLTGMVQETNTISSGQSSGNFSYRILHAKERLDYITKNTVTAVRGIGYVSEANYHHKTFKFGCYNRERNRVDQLDNGDIMWSNIFVRVGLLGCLFYLCFFGFLMKMYYENRSHSDYYTLWFSYLLITILFTSLGNETMWYGYFFMYPISIYFALQSEEYLVYDT